jgi:AcrR family transcriptional regulator
MSDNKKTREQQKIATKGKILEVATDLFINKGIMSVSTNEIAKKAGVSKGTIFHHFTNKQDLVLSVLSNFFNTEMLEMLEIVKSNKTSMETIEIIIDQTLKYAVEKPNFSAFLINVFVEYSHISDDDEKSELYKIIEDFFHPLIDQVATMLKQLGIKNTGQKARILTGLLDGLGFQLFLDRKIISDKELNTIKNEIMDIINFWRTK